MNQRTPERTRRRISSSNKNNNHRDYAKTNVNLDLDIDSKDHDQQFVHNDTNEENDDHADGVLNEDGSPSYLQHFSPSKTRALAQQSQRLTVLRRWLEPLLSVSEHDEPKTPNSNPDKNAILNPNKIVQKWIDEYQRHLRLVTTSTGKDPKLVAEDMIGWLERVMYVNRAADETRRLVYEAQREELQELTREDDDGDDDGENEVSIVRMTRRLLDEIMSSSSSSSSSVLTDQAKMAIDSLAKTSLLLGHMPSPPIKPNNNSASDRQLSTSTSTSIAFPQDLLQSIMEYTVQNQEHQLQIENLRRLDQKLKNQLEQQRQQRQRHREIAQYEKGESFNVDRNEYDHRHHQQVTAAADAVATAVVDTNEVDAMLSQTAQWNRETKLIAVKIKEYTDRLAALSERSKTRDRLSFGGRDNASGGGRSGRQLRPQHSQQPQNPIKVQDVVHLQQQILIKRNKVSKLEESIKSLNGLPPDLEASRQEVKRAKLELEYQKAKREELFAAMANQR